MTDGRSAGDGPATDGSDGPDAPDGPDASDANGTDVALIPAARAQVIALAADVVARLPADQVPAPLRPIARFAPAKRARLGGAALAAALDGDPGFRSAVAEVVTGSSPDLVAAVRDGGSTAAADPLDVAVVAYLTRPDGWVATIAAATERWTAEQGDADTVREEIERLRREVTALRAQARGEAARVRAAVEDAAAAAGTELAELRKIVRARTREMYAAERDAAAARAQIQTAREELASAAERFEAERQRQREQLAELERAAEAARRGTRLERDVDDARLWLLTDTLMQAAAGVRRELSLAAPSVRPADTVAGANGAAPARALADASSLDDVLALPNVHLVVDGYNVTKTGYPGLALADQRVRLIGSLAPLAARSGAEVTVVFDGAARPPVQPVAPRGVRVLFSAADEIADDLIRRLVAAEPPGRPIVVATSDRQVVVDTARDGAWSVASAVLLTRLG